VAHKIYSNDMLVSSLCAQGCLDLNAYIPVIGHSLLESIKLLISADNTLLSNLFDGLVVNPDIASEKLYMSPAITTALGPYIGYNKASLLAKEMKSNGISVFDANENLMIIDPDKLKSILEAQNLLKLGFSLHEIR
ncbi:MAG: aspartate ammonia-lyase, partial [Bacteroidia bacterium]|nr:aspartate ammonia-lyase [Bacteroidia bacterium]